MIVLWGLSGDPPLAAVWMALVRLGAQVAFLNQAMLLKTEIDLRVDRRVGGRVRIGGQTIDLAAVTSIYLRPHDSRRLPVVERAGPDSPIWRHALHLEEALSSWVELTPALVVNRPSRMASNGSKPYQAALIDAMGFRTPDTLITTDPEAARSFWADRGEIIYKSISGIRSIVSRLTTEQAERLKDVAWCPTQFQEYLPGTDYRVHVVGDALFACEIVSTADDYRYAARQGIDVDIRACALPAECADRCLRLAAALGLPVAGIDLRLTPDGEWYCFEVNPSPGFTYYQEACGLAIDEAIARLLIAGTAPRRE